MGGRAAGSALVALEDSKASPWRKVASTYPGDPYSRFLSENTNRGCFWFIPFLACAWLFGPLFPWDCLSFSVLYREGFIQISASPSHHTALLHILAPLKSEEPRTLCCCPGPLHQAARSCGAQHHSRAGSWLGAILATQQGLPSALPVPRSLAQSDIGQA